MFALCAPLAVLGVWWGQMTGLLWGVAVATALGGLVALGLSKMACSRQATVECHGLKGQPYNITWR